MINERMNLMKKLIKSLIFLIIVATIFTACSKKEAKTNEDGKIKINYYHVNAETQGGIAVADLVDNFNKMQSINLIKMTQIF